MRHLCNRRVLGWSLFVLLLAGLAWVLHACLPAEPRWVRRGPITPLGFGPDGKRFMTGTLSINDRVPDEQRFRYPLGSPVGTVQFWDIASGQQTGSALGDGERQWQVAVSDDRTYLAAIAPSLEDNEQEDLRVIDLTARHSRRASVASRLEWWNLSFSPAGKLLVLEDWGLHLTQKRIYLYETASLRLVAKCEVNTLPSDDNLRAEARNMQHLLDDIIETKDFTDPMPLKQALQLFYEKFAARGHELPIVVDVNAFKEAGDAQPNGPFDDEVKLPTVPNTMTMGTALRLIISQLKSNNADYLIRGKFIEVTTKDRTARIHWPHWRWSPDGKGLLLFTTDASGNGRLRRIAADGETIIKLNGAGVWLGISPDGKTLATEPPRTDREAARPLDTILLWDLPAGTPRGVIRVDPIDPDDLGNPVTFANDSRTLIITMGKPRPGNVLGAWDLETQQWLGKIPLGEDSRPLVPEPGSIL